MPEGPTARGQLPARARQLLAELLSLCDKRLEPRVQLVLDESCEQLFRMADQSRNDAEQQNLLASMREIKRARADVAPRFVSSLTGSFDRLNGSDDAPGDSRPEFSDLELVDPNQFEENVILDDIASRAAARGSLPLFELGYRVAVLLTVAPIESDALPFGPVAVCRAFRDATAHLDMPTAHRRLLYQLFEQNVCGMLRSVYDEANEILVRQRILPNLRAVLSKRTGGATAAAPEAPEAGPPSAPAPADAATEPPKAPPQPAPPGPAASGAPIELTPDADTGDAALFSVLSELLAKRRDVLGMEADGGSAGGRTAAENEVLDVLSEMQRKPAAPMMVNGRPVPRSMRHLRQDMLAQLRRFGDGQQAPRLSRGQNDTIDLMSMLFEHIGRDLHENGNGQAMLTQMQVPLLRVALTDHGFFSRKEHPARQLLDTITETASTWLDGDDSDPALAKKLRALTHRISHDFDGNLDLFVEARDEIESQLDKLRRRAEMAERRHVEAAQGRERLDVARERARTLVEERVREGKPTGLLRTMLEQAWTDVLALTILRWGERSDAFRRRLRVTDQLLRFTAAKADEGERAELRAELESGLGQVGIQGDEAEQIAARLTHDDRADTDAARDAGRTRENLPSRTELVTRLKQRERMGGDAEAKPVEPPRPLTAEEEQVLEKVRQLPFGTWLETIRQDGTRSRRKLAWYSPTTGHALLVNQRGARSDETTLDALARAVASGRIQLPSDKHESLIDRAWRSIVGSLKQFAGHGDSSSAEGASA